MIRFLMNRWSCSMMLFKYGAVRQRHRRPEFTALLQLGDRAGGCWIIICCMTVTPNSALPLTTYSRPKASRP